MGSKIMSDPRLDPRIKAMMGGMAEMEAQDAESREALLAEASSEEAVARREAMALFMDMVDNEEVAPSAGMHPRGEEVGPPMHLMGPQDLPKLKVTSPLSLL